jgi:hypothetical protein
MEMTISRRLPMVLALILAAGACDDKTAPEDPITMEESVALFKGLAGLAMTATDTLEVTANSIVLACPEGGQTKLVGSVTEQEGDTARLALTFQVTPTGCVVTGDGMQFTVDGDPSFDHKTVLEFISVPEISIRITGAITGTIKWEMGQRSGACAMALTLDAVPTPEGPLDGSFTGTMCGHQVEVDAAGLVQTSVTEE